MTTAKESASQCPGREIRERGSFEEAELSGSGHHEVAMILQRDHLGADKLSSVDEENCIDHIFTCMQSKGFTELRSRYE